MDDVEQLIAILTPAAGLERARAVVQEACAELGVPFPPGRESTRTVAVLLAQRSGAVGVAVRLALRRESTTPSLRREPPASLKPAKERDVTPVRVHREPREEPPAPPTADLVELLSSALGEATAREVVEATARRLGLDAAALGDRERQRILDLLAEGSDYVATVARFAKAKVMLEKK